MDEVYCKAEFGSHSGRWHSHSLAMGAACVALERSEDRGGGGQGTAKPWGWGEAAALYESGWGLTATQQTQHKCSSYCLKSSTRRRLPTERQLAAEEPGSPIMTCRFGFGDESLGASTRTAGKPVTTSPQAAATTQAAATQAAAPAKATPTPGATLLKKNDKVTT